MLQIRLEGDLAEAGAFLKALASGGAEVQQGTVKNRGGFHHVYAVVRMPDWSGDPAPQEPIRVEATVGQGIAPTTRRLPARRRFR